MANEQDEQAKRRRKEAQQQLEEQNSQTREGQSEEWEPHEDQPG